MDSRYNHLEHEQEMYQLWEKTQAFNPDAQGSSTANSSGSFCIIMPPPNANDPLHIGHAMFIALEDVLIRFHRMLGDRTLWLPGTDHAGIETQFVFEKKLKKEGKSRFNFDRHTLYDLIWEYVHQNSDVAVNQMKKLGASADWSRFTFTLDPDVVAFVHQTFNQLYQDGLIYRDLRLVNYCPKCGTSYSELEVNHLEEKTKLYYLHYGPFVLATTRPETKFGDTAVAVHPQDNRYQQYIGQTIDVDGLNGPIKLKVIADEYVDREFGTGVVKITPYHDFNDFEVWQRHKNELPQPQQVIGFNGKLTYIAGKYSGLNIKQAREVIEQDLKAKGLLAKVETDYHHTIGTCYRCGTVLEPLPLAQFFVKVDSDDKKKSLIKQSLLALESGGTLVHGSGREKILRHWLTNLKDWNISRQIVWGIRIPVWYSVKSNPELGVVFLDSAGTLHKGTVSDLISQGFNLTDIEKGLQSLRAPTDAQFVVSPAAPGPDFLPETDTFDTWFSSAQWPVVTLKTNQPTDFDRFYPTSVMETGYDILPFWVMRMMMMGIYLTGQTPFRQVYLHGLVRDAKGQKMSKSKGNVVNPLDMVEKYGADALRLALIIRSTPGLDKSIAEHDFKAMRNLSNKIWNAARFVHNFDITQEPDESPEDKMSQRMAENHQKFTTHLNSVVVQITQQLTDLKIGLAAETVYNEFWHWFCDECIEQAKQGTLSRETLKTGLITFLKLLHPFVPFVTEAVWQQLSPPEENRLLIRASWPTVLDTD